LAVLAVSAPLRARSSNYPEPFASRTAGRERRQDELAYVLEGEPRPGMCAGSEAASDDAHRPVNRTGRDVVHLEVSHRSPGDAVTCLDDDLQAVLGPDRT
jgi:uncharacterized cupin superfamily protein